MDAILSVSEASRKLATLSRAAKRTLQRFILTQRGRGEAVLISFTEYKSLVASRTLLSNPKVLEDTLRGMRQIKRGQGIKFTQKRPLVSFKDRKKIA
jgi:prevent-host-death family protein